MAEEKAIEATSSDLILAARQATRSSLIFGLFLAVLGVFAVMAPLFSGIAATVLVGMLLLFGGIMDTVRAFKAPSFGKGALRFIFGALMIVAALVLLVMPGEGLGAMTIVLATYLVVAGVLDIVVAFQVKPEEGWGWALFSGIVSIALGVLIVAQWPLSGMWAVGVFVGFHLLFHGMALMALGTAGSDAQAYLQARRLEDLERHLRTGARTLQEVQVMLAGQTAMLLAINQELGAKASIKDVDPAIRGLNTAIGEAREHMTRAAAAGAEAWGSLQTEAEKTFQELQQGASELNERLTKEFESGGGRGERE